MAVINTPAILSTVAVCAALAASTSLSSVAAAAPHSAAASRVGAVAAPHSAAASRGDEAACLPMPFEGWVADRFHYSGVAERSHMIDGDRIFLDLRIADMGPDSRIEVTVFLNGRNSQTLTFEQAELPNPITYSSVVNATEEVTVTIAFKITDQDGLVFADTSGDIGPFM